MALCSSAGCGPGQGLWGGGVVAKQPASARSVEKSCEGSLEWNRGAVLLFQWSRLRRRQRFISDNDNYITNVVICSFLIIIIISSSSSSGGGGGGGVAKGARSVSQCSMMMAL